jgi:hypothetical protein
MTLAAWFGLAVGVGALIFAYLAWRVSKQQLRLAEEQAKLRPNLVASVKEVQYHDLPPDSPVPHEQVAITFNITNAGKAAAHGVRCAFSFEEQLGPGHHHFGQDHDFKERYIGPGQTFAHDATRSVLEYGLTRVRYVCTCDEVGPVEGTIDEVLVPERDQP